MLTSLKRVVVGRPLASSEEEHQRLPKTVALAVFSSDAISSTAYASEEILLVLAPLAGFAAFGYLTPISLLVVLLLAVVVLSYRQTIYAYPNGGSSYVVSRENLGVAPSLVAGASILVDYILTVAVSVAAGVAAITSAIEPLRDHKVALCLVLVWLITIANLRGLKESGRLFAVPTYTYIGMLALLVGVGVYRFHWGGLGPLPVDEEALAELTRNGETLGGVSALVLMRAFSSGAVALTGTEAISDGVPAFRRPQSRNAATTLAIMAGLLGSFFFGLSYLARHTLPTPSHEETVLSAIGRHVFGGRGVAYVVLTVATAAILTLAANTAFADFPRLSSIIARDGFLPRQLVNQGDRLVFSNGILVLAVLASVLLVAFGGVTSALIPLYAVGVFTSFTLSQSGMVRHHLRHRAPGYRAHATVSAVGATATFIVLVIVAVSKFRYGAWLPAVVIPLIVLLFKGIKRHYTRTAAALAVPEGFRAPGINHTVIVLVGGVHQGVLRALAYAQSLNPKHLTAVTVASSEEEQERMLEQWAKHELEVPLEIVHSKYRDLTRPILSYIDSLDQRWDNDTITVVIPEFVVKRWWEHLLHNQSALVLKGRLLFRKETVVVSVPYHLG
ncbi:MAG: APC family permease [Acidimicrobiales bacterium]